MISLSKTAKRLRNVVGAAALGAGMLGVVGPAEADTLVAGVGVSQFGWGTNDSGNLGSVSNTQCALTRVRDTGQTGHITETKQCYLRQVNGQWVLRAQVETQSSLAFVHCEAHCYQ